MTFRLASLVLCLVIAYPAIAEKADRDKPMLLEANRVSIDDAKKIQILEGDVLITKGTMILKADRVVITEDQYGFQKGSAFSGKKGLAYFRQKREGKAEYIEGEAERIDYNTNTEIVELFQRAWVKNAEDQLKGDYIWYDAISEKYLVTAGENRDPNAPPARVRAVIQPKHRNGGNEDGASRSEPLDLKGAKNLQP